MSSATRSSQLIMEGLELIRKYIQENDKTVAIEPWSRGARKVDQTLFHHTAATAPAGQHPEMRCHFGWQQETTALKYIEKTLNPIWAGL